MGNDPVWGVASNRLAFGNGVKMKMSVIFGVLHMMMGIIHKYTNVIKAGHWAHLFAECIGGTIILLGLFGWMDLLVFNKWTTEMNVDNRDLFSPIAPVNFTESSNFETDKNAAGKTNKFNVCNNIQRNDVSLLTKEDACPCAFKNDGTGRVGTDKNGFPMYQTESTYTCAPGPDPKKPDCLTQTDGTIWNRYTNTAVLGFNNAAFALGTKKIFDTELECINACAANSLCLAA
jgi:hypothetical protein